MRSSETRKKISEGLKRAYKSGRRKSWNLGKKCPEHAEKIRGRKATEETKKKMREARRLRKEKLGYINSPEARKKLSESITGEKNYRWNPDREAVKRNLRNDGEYKQWSRKVKKRDNWKCKINNKDCSGYCIVHHILPWRDYPELRYDINNGIALCQAHHPRKRAEEKRLIPFFQELVPVSSE